VIAWDQEGDILIMPGSNMRWVTVLVMIAVVVVGLCQPALSANVTVIQGSKRLHGWTTDDRRIYITNDMGKTIMVGRFNRSGAVELYSILREDNFFGHLNPAGNGLLISPTSSDTMRIELER
jgi:hypothetical protein